MGVVDFTEQARPPLLVWMLMPCARRARHRPQLISRALLPNRCVDRPCHAPRPSHGNHTIHSPTPSIHPGVGADGAVPPGGRGGRRGLGGGGLGRALLGPAAGARCVFCVFA